MDFKIGIASGKFYAARMSSARRTLTFDRRHRVFGASRFADQRTPPLSLGAFHVHTYVTRICSVYTPSLDVKSVANGRSFRDARFVTLKKNRCIADKVTFYNYI